MIKLSYIIHQARRNGFENGGASETPVTFKPLVVQTSNLQFWKWQAKSQNMVEPWLHGSICSGGPGHFGNNEGFFWTFDNVRHAYQFLS